MHMLVNMHQQMFANTIKILWNVMRILTLSFLFGLVIHFMNIGTHNINNLMYLRIVKINLHLNFVRKQDNIHASGIIISVLN